MKAFITTYKGMETISELEISELIKSKGKIEEYLVKNQVTNLHPELMRYMVDKYLSQSNVKKSCEIFSKIKEPLQNEYLSKFNLYCLINYGKNEEAQLILDLKKELGFNDEYFENKNVEIKKFPFAMTPCYIVKP